MVVLHAAIFLRLDVRSDALTGKELVRPLSRVRRVSTIRSGDLGEVPRGGIDH
jgi:hypothetical protein